MTVRYYLLIFIMSIVILSFGSYALTRAFFTDTAVSASNTFTTAESFGTPTPTPAIQKVLVTEVSSNGNEWVEIYNDSGGNINLQNWKIEDGNSPDIITQEINFGSETHAVIVPSGSPIVLPPGAIRIEIGADIGSGLNNEGDLLKITDDKGNTVETVSWGNDTTYGSRPNPSSTQTMQRNPDPIISTKYLNTWKLGTPSAGLRNN